MEEKEILLKTIEGLNASVASLSATNKKQAEQNEKLQERIKELTAQVAWLNRQLFGRKSEKLRVYDPTMPDLFSEEFAGLRQEAEEKRDEAVKKIEKESAEVRKQNRQNRKMVEDLPVLETEVIEPVDVDLSLYRRIGEEVTKWSSTSRGCFTSRKSSVPNMHSRTAPCFLRPDRKAWR